MSEKTFALKWDFLLRTNEASLFDIDAVLDEDIKNGLTYNFNDFEKCVTYSGRIPQNNHLIKGEYLLVEYDTEPSSKTRYSGLCFPDSASEYGLVNIANASLNGFNRVLKGHSYQSSQPQLRIADFLAIVFFALWALIVIISTIYECIMVSKKKPANKWLTVFSLHSNILRVFKKTPSFERNVNCLYAIRTFSILWLIIADRFKVIYKSPIENIGAYHNWIKNGFSTFITSSDAAYDSIFIVSGFLLAIYCFRTLKAKNMNYLALLVHRYVRYGPMLLMSVIYQLTIFQHTLRGPIAPRALSRVNTCESYWFLPLLMLENFMRPDQMCVYHGWYFSIDFQFFVILPLLVYICRKARKIGFIVLSVLIGIPYIAMLGVLISFDTPYDVMNRSSIYDMHSYFRCAPWFLAIILASYCLEEEYTVKKKFSVLNTVVSFLILALTLVNVYLLQNHDISNNDVIATAIFASFHRILWAAAICWIIFLCYNLKEGDWFDGVINSSIWRPIAKISLTLQIVYPIYQHTMVFNMKEPYYFYSWNVFHSALGDILICVLISLILNASVEMPFVWMERLINDKSYGKLTRNVKKNEIEMEEIALKQLETALKI